MQPSSEGARIIEEHHTLDPRGEDEIEPTDDRRRRRYSLRPEPRRPTDLMGLNRVWWVLFWIVVVAFAVFPFPLFW